MLEERYSQLEHTSKDESKKLERSITEKNMLDEQLGKRNEEVTTLKKKVGLQENILARGESMYREREEDIRILKGEIQRLYREAEYLNKGNAIVNELRKEVLQLQRDLLREKCKVKTLETELENPINVHRWRRLEGIDPPNLELVQKTHALQKKLIQRQEQLIEKDLIIKEKEQLYQDAQITIARQPDPDLIEDVQRVKSNLRRKTDFVKQLMTELNMYITKDEEHKKKLEQVMDSNVINAVHHARCINKEIRAAQFMDGSELFSYAKSLGVPIDLLRETAKLGRLPVVNFAAGGLATPADASLLMQLGVDGCFVGSGIFKSNNPKKRAHAMVQAVTHYKDPLKLAEISEDLGEAMVGINCEEITIKWEERESMMKKA
ncbi:Pyridoxal 5'-phosphate synthase subunit PDX1.1,Probable pyridoxal 5'-phosphate synthase subunit PDX1.2,Pyridoxal 5'-phosphate synthase subunit PDX1,Pyridoxal 5'-phosphate synthase subunit PdxS,Probable pyridoxal 5'-phosphate synthase subunit PDX1,Pyridoxal 5'-phosphate synthase subunit Pdx1,Probable pyridoxal 5'-phosphate synthase subunit SNZ3,Pyridoxal 5'-phosphate synthase subunit pyroA,Probable pyridoxal 5'-phosphate synthase subunit SNZ2,Pyridoxal 5'-phosphate synthase subunit SNZ1,Probable pyridoxal 5|uniref:pyridoxal 5'-phosphate synthase (glutamine hydrolyzing) n=1 Tax=Lepeophtheirus salmonis TaxID=72036 RepID=A0A7R8D3G1_LEPSM|nr:Pyridoxal 5'-phosphate synthase subunit PDX1.1,Probable pyridoxal 5'-phosphate synthase subunit PDX1.2,Pyridoxal 5'-phosphate synthase subunit PDX1,Pyridoxal 5'-phosphate synthase subunit PdxS,Probable pyridoxal 5'-phosphate synthase subunit PDX1,Pyridoxal 5'-phosphate synthase subunit Pdx1,Probable pyridoxal 5'-phosphate synthase subunit SNZ3,Pyridoxal 5'-phosphate synthase subunit pyroA,Probable pyridoxal 5'-phosphate synthase subunit SNZ2,Pyridoxal 5'-phosphate synthase subunit SNZ1,Probable 